MIFSLRLSICTGFSLFKNPVIEIVILGVGYTGVFFWNIHDSDELKFFGCVWVSGEIKKKFWKKVHFSGFAVQNRSGRMTILGRVFNFYTLSNTKVFNRCICGNECAKH